MSQGELGKLIGHSGDYLAEPLKPATIAADLQRALSLPRSTEGADYDARMAPLAGTTEVTSSAEVIFSRSGNDY